MRMVDLIAKKKRGGRLSASELHFMIAGYVAGEIPDYQMSAMLMAVCFAGMTDEETAELTIEMERSGEIMDLSAIPGIKVDKHSTGGVGDKTTLIVAPIVAACGGKVAKMSGRGLGHTGGTIDKLESIPGYRTALGRDEFFRVVNSCGLSVISQTGNLVPADKKIYALRDVTATVDCIPLIASSIMSKKLAAGSDAILLDVKCGSGAFMKTPEEAEKLASLMVAIGRKAGKKTEALITNMDIPLGHTVGNALEVREAAAVLRGEGPEDLTEISLALASRMLALAECAPEDGCREAAEEAISSGRAFERFCAMVRAQGGDESCVRDPEKLPLAPFKRSVLSPQTGYIRSMDTEGIGVASMLLGAGRSRKEDTPDPGAGLVLAKKKGDYVQEGEELAQLFASEPSLFPAAAERYLQAVTFSDFPPVPEPLVYGHIS